MRTKSLFAVLVVLVAVGSSAVLGQEGSFYRDGDRVVFVGDSITEQHLYTSYVEGYLLTRFPKWNLVVRNAGWSGDTSWGSARGGFQNFTRDVVALKATAITIDYGMNDARGQQNNVDRYREHTGKLVDLFRGAGARVALVAASPEERFETDARLGGSKYNEWLEDYAEIAQQVAKEKGVPFVDQFHPFLAVIDAGRKNDPNWRLIGDAVHPGPPGQLIMAYCILTQLGAPSLVSSAEIDIENKAVKRQERCAITNLKIEGNSVSFDRLDEALPMPVPTDAQAVLPYIELEENLNQYMLRVRGLEMGRYDVSIDGAKVGTLSSGRLLLGWNMALLDTPMTVQANDVLAKLRSKNSIYYQRWRRVQLFSRAGVPDWLHVTQWEFERRQEEELARLDTQIAEAETALNAARLPKLHHFELRRV